VSERAKRRGKGEKCVGALLSCNALYFFYLSEAEDASDKGIAGFFPIRV